MRSAPRLHPLPFRLLGVVMVLVLIAIGAFVAWTRIGVMDAEPEPWQGVLDAPGVSAERADAGLVLRPAEDQRADTGLVFLPGAKVEPEAYAARLSSLVTELGMTVVIADPPLHLALLDRRDLEELTSDAPEIGTWLVGGHSMGGVRACALADQADGLVLFASYCATYLSSTELPVLSLAGSEDGLSTPEKIAEHRDLLPQDATMVEIDGASHASFGDYGPQRGDGTASADDAEVDAAIEEAVAEFLDTAS